MAFSHWRGRRSTRLSKIKRRKIAVGLFCIRVGVDGGMDPLSRRVYWPRYEVGGGGQVCFSFVARSATLLFIRLREHG